MISNDEQNGAVDQRLAIELRRGIVSLAVLSALQTPAYGYSLQQTLVERGFDVEQGTLYPLLRRLDEQGLLESDWNVDENRPRKYYRLNAKGAEALAVLTAQWDGLVKSVAELLATPHSDPAITQGESK